MSKAGSKIIEGLEDALAYAKGDKSKGRSVWIIRCGCCNKRFSSEKQDVLFCPKCDSAEVAG